ncbi:MAG TPA: alpha-amlyase [Methanomicrobia archaeon]|nr:alpha-amlyase [Methanomicrobia archaeon]HEX58909.1 alpha-amlyase [Methanomicrobia archaeon]
MKYICLAFEVHQPFRLRNDFFWSKRMFSGDSDIFEKYFFSEKDKEIFEKVARKCYYPTNNIILELLDDFDLRVAYSISGIFVEQCLRFDEGVLDSFKELARRDDVEILGQTYFHSLVSLYEDYAEFREQVRMHNELMHEVFGREPKFFENTELLYNNRIARFIETMGYDGIFAEGVPRILQGRSPNYVYKPVNCKRLKVLLRNYQLTDDVGFRFSSKSWNEYPLTAEKYATWLDATPGQCVNVFMDYETFGEHHWEDTGIFEFLRGLPEEVLRRGSMEFATPSEVIRECEAIGYVDVRDMETISWADVEKDTSCFIGNTMQWACYEYVKWLEPLVKEADDEEFLRIWRYFGISDHLYYMFTAGGSPGEVHSYFSHFDNPYDAFVTFFSVLHDFDARLRRKIRMADHPFIFMRGEKVWSLKGLCKVLKRGGVSERFIREHLERGDFERWVRECIHDDELAARLAELRAAAQDDGVLRRLYEILSEAAHAND